MQAQDQRQSADLPGDLDRVGAAELFWREMRNEEPRLLGLTLPATLGKIVAKLGVSEPPQAAISMPRPRDVQGRPIFTDEHDALFVFDGGGHVSYVKVYRGTLDGREVLYTEPDDDPVLRYMSPREKAVSTLGFMLDQSGGGLEASANASALAGPARRAA